MDVERLTSFIPSDGVRPAFAVVVPCAELVLGTVHGFPSDPTPLTHPSGWNVPFGSNPRPGFCPRRLPPGAADPLSTPNNMEAL